jgi:hypothetical protein
MSTGMALYLRYVYMCAVGEKDMFAIPISKTDQCFFPFQQRGSEEGYEHGFVSQVCACAPFPLARRTSTSFPSSILGSEEGYEHGFVSQVCVYVRSGGEGACSLFPSARYGPGLLSLPASGLRRAMSMALYLRYVHVRRGEGHFGHSYQRDGPGLLSLLASGLRGGL